MSLFDPRMMDPSKMSPEMLMKISQLVQELPPALFTRMQTLMHNAMAGFDVQQEMQAFERDLPSGFREKLAKLLYEVHGVPTVSAPADIENKNDARLTVLNAVAAGELTPQKALEVLFPDED